MGKDYQQEKLEKAYVAPTFGNKEAESRKAGYDDYKSGKVK